MSLKSWMDNRKDERARKEEEILMRLRSGETPQTLTELAISRTLGKALEPRVVTCPHGVVSYIPLNKPNLSKMFDNLATPDKLEKLDLKIQEILAANPDVDLKAYEAALGITIERFDRTTRKDTYSPRAPLI